MGGNGGGWQRSRKIQVEECFILSAARLQALGIIRAKEYREGTLTWRDANGDVMGEMDFVVRWEELEGKLKGCIFLSEHRKEMWISRAPLVTTPLPWGGVRWWFVCQDSCGYRRVGKLYAPPSEVMRHFSCRHCHDLTYWSSQHAHHDERSVAADMRLLDRCGR